MEDEFETVSDMHQLCNTDTHDDEINVWYVLLYLIKQYM